MREHEPAAVQAMEACRTAQPLQGVITPQSGGSCGCCHRSGRTPAGASAHRPDPLLVQGGLMCRVITAGPSASRA